MTARRETVDASVAALLGGASVVLRGPAGIGKSQTARAVTAALTDQGIGVMRAFGSASAQRIPLGALAGLLGIGDGTAADRVAQAVHAASTRSSVLVIDDAHLLDDESATAVHHLVATRAVAVLVTVRSTEVWPDAVRRLGRDDLATVFDLGPLDRAEMRTLAESTLGGALDESTFELLARASDGNPLLLIETITASLTAGRISSLSGVWIGAQIAGGSGTHELLAARIAAWDDDERELAELVAVGHAVPIVVLDRLLEPELIESALRTRIARLGDRPETIELSHPLLAEQVRAGLTHTEMAARLDRLIDAALAIDKSADVSIEIGRWALNLDDQRAIAPGKLIAAAFICHTIGRRVLTRQLIDAAERAGPDDEDRKMLVRLRAGQGMDTDTEAVGDGVDSPGALVGAAEAFLFGFTPQGDIRSRLRNRANGMEPSAERSELEALELGVALSAGAPLDAAIEALLSIVHGHDPSSPCMWAAASLVTSALHPAGRFQTMLDVVDFVEDRGPVDNEFHRVNFGVMRSEALRGLGRPAEAAAVLVERCGPAEAPSSPSVNVLANGARLEEAADCGDPVQMQRLAASVLGVLGAFDSYGIGTFAAAHLQWARAWCGEATDPSALVPAEHGMLLWPQASLALCLTRAEQGDLISARDRAHHIADQSAGTGHFLVAIDALHLMARITPTAAVAQRMVDLARHCEGERAMTAVAHVEALAQRDAVGLEKVACAFQETGRLALSLEAFELAARTFRSDGRRAASMRCREAVQRLRSDGVRPTFAAVSADEGEALTAREREVHHFATEGLSNREIAVRLGVSQRTVESHLQKAYRKLGTVARRVNRND